MSRHHLVLRYMSAYTLPGKPPDGASLCCANAR